MPSQRRRHLRAGASLLGALLLAGCAAASPSGSALPSATASSAPSTAPSGTPIPSGGSIKLRLERVATGLISPVGITSAGDGSGRLFVNEQGGRIRVIAADGTLQPGAFADLHERIRWGGEQGLLGLAFHPDFTHNGRLFVDYTRDPDGATVIAELHSADGQSADPDSERILLVIPQPYDNHNGGQIAFGPDGYLYIAMGDGGDGGDPHGNGQNRQVLLGKLLRIDVDATPDPGKAYAVPPSNPFAAAGTRPGEGLPEIWAYGLRNPWRFSFDRSTGDLYIGDVGQEDWEEVDRQPAGSTGGENYGWNVMEGTHCYTALCDPNGITLPIAEYSHQLGCAITGGYVYRGTAQPALVGAYLYADYCEGSVSLLTMNGSVVVQEVNLTTALNIASFGQGDDGELYLVDDGRGSLYHLVLDL
jgi:glucose/arabinose dehydrogenase